MNAGIAALWPEGVRFARLWVLALPLLVGAVLLLSRRARPRIETPYLGLWIRAIAESTPPERWRARLPSLAAWAGALALVAASIAAAGPVLRFAGAGRYALVLDASASMGARDRSGRTRLEAAVEVALRLAGRGLPGDRFAVLEAGPEPRLLLEETADLEAVRRALAAIEPYDARADLAGALRLARDSHPIVFTDAAGPTPEEAVLAAGATLVVVGETLPDAGFVGLEVLDAFPFREAEARVVVRNNGRSESIEVRLELEGAEVGRDRISWDEKGEGEARFVFPRGAGGRVRATIVPGDGFAANDEVGAAIREGDPPPLVLVGAAREEPAAIAFARALVEDGGVPVLSAEYARDVPAGSVAVLEGGRASLRDIDAKGVLAFGAEIEGWTSGARAIDSPCVPEPFADGVAEGLPLDDWVVRRALAVRGEVRTHASCGGFPLLVEFEGGDARVFLAAASLRDSNLGALPVFPILARRAYARLASGEARVPPFVRTGRPPPGVPLEAWAGGRLERPALRTGESAIPGVPAVFLDPEESDLAPRRPAGASGPVPEGPGFEEGATLTALAVALAFALLRLALALPLAARRARALPVA